MRDLTPESLAEVVGELLADRPALAARADIARQARYPDALEEIATHCLRVAEGPA